MATLEDPRREQFAQLVASGKALKESYAWAGYKGKGASQSANRLNKEPRVSARIAELRLLAQQIPVASSWLNENFVLQGLKDVFHAAFAKGKYGDAIGALNLMGKKMGMWVEKIDHGFWDGNPDTLTEAQVPQLMRYLERIAEEEKVRQAQLPAGEQVIRVKAESNETESDTIREATSQASEPEEDIARVEEETPAPVRRSWAEIADPEERRRLAGEWSAKGPALPEGLNREETIAWLDMNWPIENYDSPW